MSTGLFITSFPFFEPVAYVIRRAEADAYFLLSYIHEH
jgi:hypothetical protein